MNLKIGKNTLKGKLGKENWLTVYEYTKHPYEKVGFYCALIPPTNNERKGTCRCFLGLINRRRNARAYFYGSTKETKYFRYGNNEGIESLIISRSFYGIKEPYLEVSEEFRHLFNLYEDKSTGGIVYILRILEWDLKI